MWEALVFFAIDKLSAAFGRSEVSYPQPALGTPCRPDDNPRRPIRWLHVPVTLRRNRFQRHERPLCQAYLLLESGNREPRGEAMMLTIDGLLAPQDEVTIREDQTWRIPVAIRAAVPGLEQTASVNLHWPPFGIPHDAARITGHRTIVDRREYPDVEPGAHRMGLSVWYRGRLIAARNYILTVPAIGESNNGFDLRVGDRLSPYRL